MKPNHELSLKKTHDHAMVKGPRLVVVFIHGIATDSSNFESTLEHLENIKSLDAVRFVTFDLLGAGKSLCDDELDYSYTEQLTALHNSIQSLHVNETPLILVGHSMGALIAARYASAHKNAVKQLILVSPPMYSEKDLASPAFAAGIKVFKEAVAIKDRKILEKRAFNNSIKKIILNRHNYSTLSSLQTPTVIIYGNMDQFIASHNIADLLKKNPTFLSAVKTEGRHGVTKDKYTKIAKILEEDLDNETL